MVKKELMNRTQNNMSSVVNSTGNGQNDESLEIKQYQGKKNSMMTSIPEDVGTVDNSEHRK